MSNGEKVKQEGMDRAGELPLERRVAERRVGASHSALHAEPAGQQIDGDAALAGLERFEPAIFICSEIGTGMDEACMKADSEGRYILRSAAIRALASQPAAPVQPTMFDTFDNILKIQRREAESGDPYMVGLYNGMAMMCSNVDGVAVEFMQCIPAPASTSTLIDSIMALKTTCYEGFDSAAWDGYERGFKAAQKEVVALIGAAPAFPVVPEGVLKLLNDIADFMARSVNCQQSHDCPPDFASEFDYNLAQAADEIRGIVSELSAAPELPEGNQQPQTGESK